jgi:hypothetical protein
MELCFEIDEKIFGNMTKTVRGVDAGAPYEITYTPSKDIAGEHIVDVTYGLMAGLNPNQALVFGLQARGDQLISRDFLRRQMPWEVNVTQEEQKIEVEKLRDSLTMAIGALANSIPQMASSGQDPSDVLSKIAAVIEGRQKGEALETVIAKAFAPAPQPQPEQGGQMPPEMPGMPGGAPPTGLGGSAAPAIPQGRPDVQMLLAGLNSRGNPSLSSSVQRMIPAG